MTERVRFHFDPLCPWAWQSSQWIREVSEARDVEIDWDFFSLQFINEKPGETPNPKLLAATEALRTLVLVDRQHGNEKVGDLYQAIGERIHEGPDELSPAVIRGALEQIGLDADIYDAAVRDRTTQDELRSRHDEMVERVGAFGVPTIVFESGMSIFGPVIGKPYGPERSAEMYDHVKALTNFDGFFELKRSRDRKPGE